MNRRELIKGLLAIAVAPKKLATRLVYDPVHRTIVRTGLPIAHWRLLNQGKVIKK